MLKPWKNFEKEFNHIKADLKFASYSRQHLNCRCSWEAEWWSVCSGVRSRCCSARSAVTATGFPWSLRVPAEDRVLGCSGTGSRRTRRSCLSAGAFLAALHSACTVRGRAVAEGLSFGLWILYSLLWRQKKGRSWWQNFAQGRCLGVGFLFGFVFKETALLCILF